MDMLLCVLMSISVLVGAHRTLCRLRSYRQQVKQRQMKHILPHPAQQPGCSRALPKRYRGCMWCVRIDSEEKLQKYASGTVLVSFQEFHLLDHRCCIYA